MRKMFLFIIAKEPNLFVFCNVVFLIPETCDGNKSDVRCFT